MNKIPIVLASDRNCVFQLYTTILSALENKNKDTFYTFYCLIPKKFSKFIQKKFQQLTSKYTNNKIIFICMKNAFNDVKIQIAHITLPTFYRLKIAELLPKEEKILYLDIDTIVLEDLTELYNTSLNGFYIAGVHEIGQVVEYKRDIEYYNKIGLKNLDTYINAGVTLWNLELIRQNDITPKLLELAKNTYRYMDQDIINLAFFGKVKLIAPKYNLMASYKKRFLDNPETKKVIYNFYGENVIESAINSPTIIHYNTTIKPWTNKKVWLSEFWLKYAKKVPQKIDRFQKTETGILRQLKENKRKKIMFWGASIFLEELFLNKKIIANKNILGIIDKNSTKHGQKIENVEICSPDSLEILKPDVIIFSILHNQNVIYADVKEFLQKNYPKIKLLPNTFNKK